MHVPHIFVREAALALLWVHGILFHLATIVSVIQDLIVIFVLDEQVHDLTCTGPYHSKSRISQCPFYRVNISITDSSHDLHGIVNDGPSGFSREPFGFTDKSASIWIVLINGPRCQIGKPSGCIQLSDGVGHHKIDGLKFSDWFAEGFTPAGIPHSQIQSAPHSQATGRGGKTFRDHHLVETKGAAVQFSDKVAFWNFDIPEYKSSGTATLAPHQAVEILCFHAGAFFNDQQAYTVILVASRLKIRAAVNQEEISSLSPHNKSLLARNDEVVAVEHSPGGGSEEVRSSPRFRQRFGSHKLSFQIRL